MSFKNTAGSEWIALHRNADGRGLIYEAKREESGACPDSRPLREPVEGLTQQLYYKKIDLIFNVQ